MDSALRVRFETKYRVWKEKLLDLSGSNRLLNFRTTKVSTIKATAPDIQSLFQKLVIAEKALRFPLYEGRLALASEDTGGDGSSQTMWRVRPGEIETSKSPPELEKSLRHLAQLARASLEERGVNTLYMALGMLEWRPIDGAEMQLAPLLMVPVELSRETRLEPFELIPLDEDPEINPSLVYMLRKDFEFAVPDFDSEPEEASLEKFFRKLEKAVHGRGWRVVREAWLGQFQFKKLAMYKDLEDHSTGAPDHGLLTSVAGCTSFSEPPDIPAAHAFDAVKPSEVFTIRDADSSQLTAVLRARAGQDLIIQGPPGTGKSQTIANLIAQFLLEGRKILFVSEKMAALSVVYRRLQEAGLGPFCLEIHSDKSNKRDVLNRIRRSRPSVRPQVSSQERLKFETLLGYRRELNSYVRALHEPVLHDQSAFDVHGELARLCDTPDVLAKLDLNPADVTPEREFELLKLARKLAQLPAVFSHYDHHPWHGCIVDLWSMNLQATVTARFKRFRELIEAAQALSGRLADLMATPQPDSLYALTELSVTAKLFRESPCPPSSWMEGADHQDLVKTALDWADKSKRISDLRTTLEGHYDPSLFEQNCLEIDGILNESSEHLLQSIRRSQPRAYLAENGDFEINLENCRQALSEVLEVATALARALDEPTPSTTIEGRRLAQIGAIAVSDPKPTLEWFDWSVLGKLREEVDQATGKAAELGMLRARLSEDWGDGFFKLPLAEWHEDFAFRFARAWRILQPEYRRRRKRLQHSHKSLKKLSYADMREMVAQGAKILELDEWFGRRREEHRRLLGFHYRGSETRWEEVAVHIESVRTLLEMKRASKPSESLVNALVRGGTVLRGISDLSVRLSVGIRSLDGAIASLGEALNFQVLLGSPTSDEYPTGDFLERLSGAHECLVKYRSAIKALRMSLRPGCMRDSESMASDAADSREVQESEREFDAQAVALKNSFGRLFRERQTDWQAALRALAWTRDFLSYLRSRPWGSACAEASCALERVAAVGQIAAELESLLPQLSEEQAFHGKVFDEAILRFGDKALLSAGLRDLIEWLDSKVLNVGSLSEWIQFREVREECAATGIDDFLRQAIESNLPAESLVPALKKRLLVARLDAIYEHLPRLRKFQWRDHDQLVNEFRELDRQLMKTYANLVQGAVIDRQPNLEGPSAGQIGFLRHELAKQKRHAPLRKLFRESGSVILDLTPCLLMSPLSVATFLPKDSVHFDVVIFDEASQVPSEEATGAILRGRQLIVAGDPKQLPPTRFFERTSDGGDDDEDDVQTPLDSLLEDCDASGMQSCRLLWHYRSKHEALISFSNAEFYGNDLITFPAPQAHERVGIGVRHIHVPDGVYDRGHSRTNRREAEKVAELIELHCGTWGRRRSLGVIALSTAQEAAINEELERLLLRRPDLEVMLKRDNDEGLFVKPLENVQGDERDTIIISVGYGKDSAGLLSLNFGPLNSQGGEKRLNVAVTRARWELIVVSSILAHDIDESRVQSIGPKLLRRYLDFAREGRLPVETAAPTGESESPFELSVWEALRARGVEVDRQVGTSRYRIDMAVKDPAAPGRYLLGIECDGATYHSSAVARDRDRLRQQILESHGWKIHRIWSTDWIRDPKGCVARLVQRIDELKNALSIEVIETSPVSEVQVDGNIEQEAPLVVDRSALDSYDGHPGIGLLQETPASFRPKEAFHADDALVEDDVVRVVEREGPIHEELLVRRVARMFQLMRTGHVVESRISFSINAVCRKNKILRKGNFLWSSSKDGVEPRRPAPGVKLRDIEFVPVEELQAAALLVVRLTRGITEDELAGETARVLGYSRITDNIRGLALKAVRKLVSSGTLVVRGEQLFASESQRT